MGLKKFEQALTLKCIIGSAAGLALGSLLLTILGAVSCDAQDDWQMVSLTTVSAPPATSDTFGGPAPAIARVFTVCGERATVAEPKIKSMFDRINGLWKTNFAVYQTIAPEQPHASPGGCVFYNPAAMTAILTTRLDVKDQQMVDPLVWAIFAHEIGHQFHQDTDECRKRVPGETKELEADRFAGYTLEKLKIPAADLTAYWSLTGDDFGGPVSTRNQHGLSSQRVAAFKQGWHLAEWNRAEDSQSVAEAEEEPVAPDDSESAPN
jgi:hypothetical protein